METKSTTSVCDNVAVESFDWDKYEQGVYNYEQEIKDAKARLAKAKRDTKARLAKAKKDAKVKEAEKVNKIKALLEANKRKRVVVEWIFEEGDTSSALAEDITIVFNKNNCWTIDSTKDKWGGSLEIVKRIYVEAEI